MTDILCDWLNREVKLSRAVKMESFAQEFSSGYLIGELLNKFELQDDFAQFSQSRLASAKLNNFSRMEPTLQLLGVQFDQNVARNIMTEQHGAATKLIYQLYVALEKKKKAGLTGVAMDAMRPSAPAKLKSVGTEMYRERLKCLVPRQVDLTLQQISDNFHSKAKDLESQIARMQFVEQQQAKKIQAEKIVEQFENKMVENRRQHEIMAKIQAAIIQIPKPVLQRPVKAIEDQKIMRRRKEAEITYAEIKKFEKQMKKESGMPTRLTESMVHSAVPSQELDTTPAITDLLNTYSDDEYIRKIQKRLEEDTFAREQREKRRRKMLREQLIAHEAQEEAYREEQLINRLMRQSQQERRIAVQLLHVRHEKEVMWQNRIYREKQFEERRLKEFQEALDREEALAKQEKIEQEEQALKEKQLHAMLAAKRAEDRYKKHYSICWEVVEQIIDLSTKIGEYRTLTNNLIPIKLMRDWKELFLKGKPIYEQAEIEMPLPDEPTPGQLVELDKMNLLDEKDYDEYKKMIEEWYPPEDIRANKPPPGNPILGYIIHRLLGLFYPPEPEPPPPVLSPFPIKGCILGKHFSGKSTCLKFLEEVCNIQVMSIDKLITEAIRASNENEPGNDFSPLQAELEVPTRNQIEVLKAASRASITLAYDLLQDVKVDETPEVDEEPVEQSPSVQMIEQEKMSDVEDDLSKLSIRAQLGAAAESLLKKGKSIPDELLVGIMVEAISRLPPESGWILDGFPMTLNQAKLLEKALTRRDPDQTEAMAKNFKPVLVPDPSALKEPPVHPPALDFAMLLEVSDDTVLNRVAFVKPDSHQGRLGEGDQVSEVQFHDAEKDDSVRSQMQHRIIGFLETWPKLENWYSEQQNILIKVNAETEENLMCQRVKEIITEEIVKIQNKRKEEEKREAERLQALEAAKPLPQEEVPAVSVEKVEEPAPAPSPEVLEPPPAAPKESPPGESPKKGKKGKKDKGDKGKEGKPGTPRGKEKGKTAPASAEDVPPPPPVELPRIKPGSDEWVYVDEPLPQEVPEFLVPYWETVEKTYKNNIKATLRCLRGEQHVIIHYLSHARNHFREFLTRPDHKQEFVTQWQADYNSVADDLWEDDETKEELHQRVTDLRDRLWDICENRRDEAEQERNDIMSDGWLPDRLALLMNHIFSLMQNELDRFQDTKRLLHDYYRGMEGKIPTETSNEFARIPLIDLTDKEQPMEEAKTRIIPLSVHRAASPEPKDKMKAIPVKIKDDVFSESIIFNFAPEEKQITEMWHNIVATISNMVTAEIQAKEAEEEKERLQQEMKEKERQKSSQAEKKGKEGKGKKGKGGKEAKGGKDAKGGKGGKDAKGKEGKDAKGKKGKKKASHSPPEPTPTPIPLSPEELKKLELRLKMKQEYFAALEHEAEAAKSRLELLKAKALAFTEDLQTKAEVTYRNMEKWLGERFLAEMASVDKLTEVARHHIETSTKIQYELVLEGVEFYINGDVKVFPDPLPPPRPPSVEMPTNGTLTISQLSTLHKQFLQVAPKGLIPSKTFIDIVYDLITLNLGSNSLPDAWLHLSIYDLQGLAAALTVDSDTVDWRIFLQAASQPWPLPSVTELLETLQRFQDVDVDGSGFVTEEEYDQVGLWFKGSEDLPVPESPTEPFPFNRQEHLIKFFFSLFADPEKDPPQLNYTEMLLYFASDPDSVDGVYRALSVATGTHIHREKQELPPVPQRYVPSSEQLITSDGQDEQEEEEAAEEGEEEEEEKEKEEEAESFTNEGNISLDTLLKVFQHETNKAADNHRFNGYMKPEDTYEHFIKVYRDLGSEDLTPIPVALLLQHPFIQDLINSYQQYKLHDFKLMLQTADQAHPSDGDTAVIPS
ncbi:flagellar 2 [Podarcis lilfordi]|uniref:Flagellar 2 n=1 Tax=Podarcis lilfordi TaxID=74358 RepID=A0AA35PJG3_9SAUR|nr:flagellar 2 [Podarcis lilfordi]